VKTWNVISGVAWRTLKNALTNPQILLPTMLFPLFFFTAFAGGLSQVSRVPGFDFPPGYTAFQFVFVLLQSAAFSGVFTGFGVARDFEGGFAKRLMLAAPRRTGIVVGYALAALVRWSIVAVLLTLIALVVGMNVGGGVVDLAGLYVLAALVNFCGFFWAGGIAMRFRTIQAGPLMQMPVFLILFFAPVYVPLNLLEGWIHREPGHVPPRDRARVHRRRRAARRGGVRDRDRPRAALLDLGLPRSAQRGSRGRLGGGCAQSRNPRARTPTRLRSLKPRPPERTRMAASLGGREHAQEGVDDLRVELGAGCLDEAPLRLLDAE
jgi:ABC-2 type transport system permease protein